MKTFVRRFIAGLFERQVRRLISARKLKVVAVGGSVGKSTTKLAIAAVLSQKYATLVHPGNYNSELGLPLSVFELTVPGNLLNPFAWGLRLIQSERRLRQYPYEVLVLELGTDHPGEMSGLLRYLKPHIGVITAITPEHMENFPGGLDEVADEELQLAAASDEVVAGVDDIPAKYRHKYIDVHPRHHYFGLAAGTDYGFIMKETGPLSGTTGFLTNGGHVTLKTLHFDLFGAHSARTAAAAYAVGDLLGLTKAQIADGLAQLKPMEGRMNPLPTVSGGVVIDDTYNAQPDAVLAALAALAAAPTAGRRIAILGSMNELGEDSAKYHEQVGAAAAGVDYLVTIGKNANDYLGPAAVRAGLDPSRFQSADSPTAAGEYVKLLLRAGDLVLAKGSQNGVFAEEAVKVLLGDPQDASKLVRQSPAWLRVKARQFPRG